MEYQFKYDSTQGTYKGEVSHDAEANELIINDQHIKVFSERDPSQIAWGSQGVQCVAECTSIFKNVEKAQMHIGDGVVKVVVSAPNDGPMFVMGVNHTIYKK